MPLRRLPLAPIIAPELAPVQRRRALSPYARIFLSFAATILVGTLLLVPPWASAAGTWTDWSTALFTATSAVCVTGLVVVDTGSYWSPFGQGVIAVLIQLGGLGILTFSLGLVAALRGGRLRAGDRETARVAVARQRQDPGQLLRFILYYVFGLELVGAALLTVGFLTDAPWPRSLGWGLFHAISAFCNAGFSLTPASLERVPHPWLVQGVVAALVVAGGLGFPTAEELWRRWRAHRHGLFAGHWSLHLRLVIVVNLVLWLGGAAVLWLLQLTGRPIGPWEALQAAIHARTAGFNATPMDTWTRDANLVTIVLMFVGASPGGTGGGVKTTSFAVVLLTLWAVLRQRVEVVAFGRRIPPAAIYRALFVFSVSAMAVLGGWGALLLFEPRAEALELLYEVVSAYGTVGLSLGVTPELSVPGRLVTIVLMFFGRLGPLALAYAMVAPRREGGIRYPSEEPLIG